VSCFSVVLWTVCAAFCYLVSSWDALEGISVFVLLVPRADGLLKWVKGACGRLLFGSLTSVLFQLLRAPATVEWFALFPVVTALLVSLLLISLMLRSRVEILLWAFVCSY
jgi:hypothetical protein